MTFLFVYKKKIYLSFIFPWEYNESIYALLIRIMLYYVLYIVCTT